MEIEGTVPMDEEKTKALQKKHVSSKLAVWPSAVAEDFDKLFDDGATVADRRGSTKRNWRTERTRRRRYKERGTVG